MKTSCLILLIHALVFQLADSKRYYSWIIDDRCLHRRQLEGLENGNDGPAENSTKTSDGEKDWEKIATMNSESQSLRGVVARNRELQVPERTFNVRLYWKEGYCWQEEWIERFWCAQCEGRTCDYGDSLRLQVCDRNIPEQRFEWISYFSESVGRLKVANKNLCLQRITTNQFELRQCNLLNDKQLLTGFRAYDKFQIHPDGDEDLCLSNHHHPKPDEILRTEECTISKRDRTSYWYAYLPDPEDPVIPSPPQEESNKEPAGEETSKTEPEVEVKPLKFRIPWCRPDNPCDLCEGDCDEDVDCVGDLQCFHRDKGASPTIDGCSGTALHEYIDYCVKPIETPAPSTAPFRENVFASTAPSEAIREYLRTRGSGCSVTEPCQKCEGVCESDDECEGDLRCFFRTDADVPGCFGRPKSGKDYCYDPSQ